MNRAVLVLLAITTLLSANSLTATQEIIKEQLRVQKREVMSLNVAINDSASTSTFWQIYETYEASLAELNEQYVAVLSRFGEQYETLTNEQAHSITTDILKIRKQREKIIAKTYKQLAKKVSPIVGSQFLQVDHRIRLALDAYLAQYIPIVQEQQIQLGE